MNKKARFECRLNAETHLLLKTLADDAGVSMNQVIEGVLVWATTKAYAGLPSPHQNGNGYFVSDDSQAIWFGSDGFDAEGNPIGGGKVIFALDFTPGRTVRQGMEIYDG